MSRASRSLVSLISARPAAAPRRDRPFRDLADETGLGVADGEDDHRGTGVRDHPVEVGAGR
ncbi:MAG: hypothetical protein SYR96_21690 [Actinomycetota bacterium]|nr:hypothetical protein [Actinomycetota bacterium]